MYSGMKYLWFLGYLVMKHSFNTAEFNFASILRGFHLFPKIKVLFLFFVLKWNQSYGNFLMENTFSICN